MIWEVQTHKLCPWLVCLCVCLFVCLSLVCLCLCVLCVCPWCVCVCVCCVFVLGQCVCIQCALNLRRRRYLIRRSLKGKSNDRLKNKWCRPLPPLSSLSSDRLGLQTTPCIESRIRPPGVFWLLLLFFFKSWIRPPDVLEIFSNLELFAVNVKCR